MKRTIVIGDIHGCVQTLRTLLKLCDLHEQTDKLIILGDAFDRGPASYEVFLELLRLEESMGDRFVYILGNHDQMLLDAETHPGMDALWMQNGSEQTIRSFERGNGDLGKLRRWLGGKGYFHREQTFVCVHAGVEHEDLEDNERDVLIWSRIFLESTERYQGILVLAGHTPVAEAVYIPPNGEITILEAGQKKPLPEKGAVMLDTGCVYRKKLTALIAEKGLFQIIYADYCEEP